MDQVSFGSIVVNFLQNSSTQIGKQYITRYASGGTNQKKGNKIIPVKRYGSRHADLKKENASLSNFFTPVWSIEVTTAF